MKIFFSGLFSEAMPLGKTFNVFCAKPNHQMPTNKKEICNALLSLDIPNHSFLNNKTKQIICNNTLPI